MARRKRVYKVLCRDCTKYKVFKLNDFSCGACKELFDRTVLKAFDGTDPTETPLAYYMDKVPLDCWQFVEAYARLVKSNALILYKDGF